MEWTIEIIFSVPSHTPAPISIEIEWKLSFSIFQSRYLSLIPSICSFFAVHFFGWDACVVLQNMVMISGCICIWKAWHFDLNWVISCFLLRSLHAPDFPAIFKVWQVIVRPFSWAVTLLWTRKLILLLAKWNNALVNIVGVNCIQIGHVHKIHSRLFSASHECAQPLSCSD